MASLGAEAAVRCLSRRVAVFAAVALLPLAAGSQATAAGVAPAHVTPGQFSVLSAADVQRLSDQATEQSIIILKNQHPDLPATGAAATQRVHAVDADQAGIRSELSQLRAPGVKTFHLVNAVAATISQAESDRLAANPAVQAVVPDIRQSTPPLDSVALSAATNAPTAASAQDVCPADSAQPLIEPEALQIMNVEFQSGSAQPAAHDLADGSGVKVGIIADGLDPNNPDLIRSNGDHVVYDFRDFSGYGNDAPTDGRESFLDAGSIASQANVTYDLAGWVNPAHALPAGCTIRIKGVAPGSSLAVMNVAGSAAGFFNSQIIQAIEWAVNVDKVDVLNESIGDNPIPDTQNDPVALADQAAVDAGVTVVASSGDSGPTGTIGSPASGPGIITVGGSTAFRVYRQTGRYGTQLVPGGWESNNITALSSAGTTEFGPRTVDVVAPGDRGWTLCSNDTKHFTGCPDVDKGVDPPPIWAAGGTSASAPLTSGTAALVIQAYQRTHGGSKPSPDLVKRIIVSSATDLGAPADHQGAGLVNSLRAVQLAQSIAGDGNNRPAAGGLLVSTSSLISTAPTGARRTFHVDVTNENASPQTVNPDVVGLNPAKVSNETGTVNLGASSPTFVDGEGFVDPYRLRKFDVPPGTGYLSGDIVWDAVSEPKAIVQETVFDPLGRVAGYSLLGSDHSGRGHVEIRKPMAGTWTAVIFTVTSAPAYTGSVHFSYFTQRFQNAGSVSPAIRRLAPGQTAGFNVTVTSGPPGDLALSLRLATGASNDGSIPILLRSLVPVNRSGGGFQGKLTGGANTSNSGQRISYQFDLPAGQPSLNVAIHLRDPNYQVEGFLVDPLGEPLDIQSTAVLDDQGDLVGYGSAMQFFRRTPQAGRWTLTLVAAGGLDGTRQSEPFSGVISFTPPAVSAQGLPTSPRTVLPAGQPVTAILQIANTGNAGKDFFADARLEGRQSLLLLGAGTAGVALPLSTSVQPYWLVPPGTTAFAVVAQGTVPVLADLSAAHGDPERIGASLPGNWSVASLQAPEVAPGLFFGVPEAVGPFPANGLGHATVNLGAVATTNPFDAAVSADSGDFWAASIDQNAVYSPLHLEPGQTGTITVTITPNAPRGTVVHGYLAVDTFNFDSLSGDELIDIPYSYRVG